MSRPDPINVASERDRLFFERHPRRSCRVRPAIAGELPGLTTPAEGWAMIAVRQIAPGVRARMSFTAPAIIPDSEATTHSLMGVAR